MTYSGVPGDRNKCECADPGCPIHPKVSDCRNLAATILYRIDMEDNTGSLMCEGCAEDAMLSGLFTDELVEDIED
jgi:hypothetical protein